MTDLVCLGEPLIELNETQTGQFQLGIGGDINNCAIAAARSGLKVGIISALGKDRFAQPIRKLWQQEGINDNGVSTDTQRTTGIYFIHHDKVGHHFSYARKGSAASAFTLSDIQQQMVAEAKILHLSGISLALSQQALATAEMAIEIAKTNQTLISFDTNYRTALWPIEKARPIINQIAQQTDFLFPSSDDANQLLKTSDIDEMISTYRQGKVKTIVLTLGSKGALIDSQSFKGKIKPYPVAAIDATAAGDTFDGAFLAAYLQSGNINLAANYASAAAALCVTQYGAINAIPTSEQIKAFQLANN